MWGMIDSSTIGYALGWTMSTHQEAFIVDPIFVIGVGIFLNFHPGCKAKQLDPITAPLSE